MANRLERFSAQPWLRIAEKVIDARGASVPLADLCAVVRHVRDADLNEANRYAKDGVQWLTKEIVDTYVLARVFVVEDEGYKFDPEYLDTYKLGEGGVLLRTGVGLSWTELYPAEMRARRVAAERERNEGIEMVRLGAQQVRRGLRPVELPDKPNARAREQRRQLYSSLLEFGYNDVFPVLVSPSRDVVDGRHRLEYAPQVQAELREQLAEEEASGADQALIASLKERIDSLDVGRIVGKAVVVKDDQQQVEAAIASDAHIPWDADTRKKLVLDGASKGRSDDDLAATFGASTRTVRRWVNEAKRDQKVLRDREILRLAAASNLTQEQIARLAGCAQKTVSDVLSKNGQVAKTTKTTDEKIKMIEEKVDGEFVWFKRHLVIGYVAGDRKTLLEWFDQAYDSESGKLRGELPVMAL